MIILGSGPNRIGQGIEFDYSCVHAALALKGEYETVMVNCNPETVSTDYDTSDRLYFEPLSAEGVLNVMRSPGLPKMLRISAGLSPVLPNQCGILVSNAATSPGPSTKSWSPRMKRMCPDRT